MNRMLLVEALRVAVPLCMMELDSRDSGELTRIAQASGTHLGSHGDRLLFRSQKKGETAEAFNRLAQGLAAAALLAPDGIGFADLHWCPEAACPGPDVGHPGSRKNEEDEQ
ncbi:hypothetical protein [Streptomyces sp. NPDC014733]|uniref:hypothetical protein n=1 Tax=Streptomyces sp. NPDC014733 TaxID=3364885 RepID=UPI0036F51277